MIKLFKISFTLLTFSLVSFVAFGQNLTATVNVNTVTVGQQFRLTYNLKVEGRNFVPPKLAPNFKVLSGPNQGYRHEEINGRVSNIITLTYIMMAVKEGSHTIPPAVVETNNGQLKSNTITMTVLNASEAEKQKKIQQQQERRKQEKAMRNSIFIKLFVNKRKVYQGEQLVATYKLYTRVDIAQHNIEQEPKLNGFYTQEIDNGNAQPKQEILNGVQYTTYLLKQMVLTPQQSGKLLVDGFVMKTILRIPDNSAPRGFFDMFGSYKEVPYTVNCNTAKITVKELPKRGKPDSFNGIVGNIKVTSNLDKDEVKANEAINYKISFAGSGNLKLISDPELDLPPDFEVFDPKEKANVKVSESGMNGKKSFEYLIIPRHAGRFTIPALTYAIFNPKTGKYSVQKTEEYSVNVLKGDGEEANSGTVVDLSRRQKDVALLGKDIRYIKKSPKKLKEAGSVFFGSTLFWILIAVPSLLFGALLAVRKRLREMQADVVGMNKRKAGKTASKHLNAARKKLSEGATNDFYEEVFKSLHQYLGMKLNIPVAELNKDFIIEKLQASQVNEDLIKSFIQILEECEMARYAPSAAMNPETILAKAETSIQQLEGGIK